MLNPPIFFSSPKNGNPGGDDDGQDDGLYEAWKSLASSWEDLSLVELPFAAGGPSNSAPANSKSNGALIDYFRAAAQKENLDLEANYFYVRGDSLRILHNKGMIVDGKKVLISSINWTENSLKNNRECAVLVESPEVASFYKELFESDWTNFRNFN
jgi:hypothetical protein